MDGDAFDDLTRGALQEGSRRKVLRLGLAALVGVFLDHRGLFTAEQTAAKNRRRKQNNRHTPHASRHDHGHVQAGSKKKHKKKHCAQAGQTPGNKRKGCCLGLVQDGAGLCVLPGPPPPVPPCVPRTCPPTPSCGSLPDGCDGTLTCSCPANQACDGGTCQPCVVVGEVCQPCIVVDGVCQPCTVTCHSDNPDRCQGDLQMAVNGGGTVYVCPGRYYENLTLTRAVTVIGAGDGTDPISDTILDGAKSSQQVLTINIGVGLVELERLRITGGTVSESGAGILHGGTALHMTECTVSGNTTVNASGGAGIFVIPPSTLEMTRCTVRDNHATVSGSGGGIWTEGTTTLNDCLIEGNSAADHGGGLSVPAGTTTLAGSTQMRGNTAVAGFGGGIANGVGTVAIAETCRVTENTAAPGKGGGISSDIDGTVTLAGDNPSPIVVNNCHENCFQVPKCSPVPPVSCPP